MSLSGLSATSDYPSGYRSPERRAAPDGPATEETPAAPAPSPPETLVLDVGYYASRFKADLSRLKPVSKTETKLSPPEAEGDPRVFDFFGNLSVLLLAVRAGDLARAQSAADALEMDVLVERSSGRRTADASMLEDLGRLFGAAHSHDETSARAAARHLAGGFAQTLAPPTAALEPIDSGGAAYETLAHYFDDDAHAV